MQQQEKLKQKLQQHTIVPLTPGSDIQLVQSQTSDDHPTSSLSCQSV
jgi:hypothetical protein